MKKENVVIFGVTGVVFAAALIGGGIYMKTERDQRLYAGTASAEAGSDMAEEVQKAVFLAEDSGVWYLGDLEHGTIYVTHTPSDTLYDENGSALDPSEIKKGDFLQVEGDGIMLESYPGQYPGISRISRISGGTEADAEKFEEELSEILPEKDPSEIPFLNLCYTQPNAQVTTMATQGGYTWSYTDENGNGQSVVADSPFILEWSELNDLNTANDEGKTDLELVFSQEPESVTAKKWPTADRGKDFDGNIPKGESVSVEYAKSWTIPEAEAGYIYEVDAVFENGTVTYGFEVKK